MTHSIGWSDECNAERDAVQAEERVARNKAARLLTQIIGRSVRVDEPEFDDMDTEGRPCS